MADGIQDAKRRAGEAAAREVRSGMVVGLGHGSTAVWAVRAIAARLASGELTDVLGVPCSLHVEAQARELGIPLTDLEVHPTIDLTIDGADEVDHALNIIKGGGGALWREKIVAQASTREAIVVDASKLSSRLGTRFALPVEVPPFALGTERRFLEGLGATVTRRKRDDGEPFVTDQGNAVLDCAFGPLDDAPELARLLDGRAGIAAHGLFIGLAHALYVADPTHPADGVRVLTPSTRAV